MKHVVAIVSDLHCGSTVGLCPPTIGLDDGGTYHASPAQQWLWQNYQAFWKRVAEVRKGATLLTVFNGDLVDGDHHGTTQILSGNPTAQAAVLDACMKTVLGLKPDHMLFIRGTSAHVGKSASSEERIAKGLHKDGWPVIHDPVNDVYSWWRCKREIQGVRLDFAHHGRYGQRVHTRHNIAVLLANQIWAEHKLRDDDHPHLSLRSHLHQFADTYHAFPTRLIQTPAFQLATEFVHRIATESLADIGGIIVTISEGKYDVEPVLFKPDPIPYERIA